jgi:hypothetical protein
MYDIIPRSPMIGPQAGAGASTTLMTHDAACAAAWNTFNLASRAAAAAADAAGDTPSARAVYNAAVQAAEIVYLQACLAAAVTAGLTPQSGDKGSVGRTILNRLINLGAVDPVGSKPYTATGH